MIASLALALLVTLSGTIATYLYDEKASLGARLCSGVCLGLAAFSLIGFVVASLVGLTAPRILISAAICCSPARARRRAVCQRAFKHDLQSVSNSTRPLLPSSEPAQSIGYFLFYAGTTVILWKVFDRAVIEDADGHQHRAC